MLSLDGDLEFEFTTFRKAYENWMAYFLLGIAWNQLYRTPSYRAMTLSWQDLLGVRTTSRAVFRRG